MEYSFGARAQVFAVSQTSCTPQPTELREWERGGSLEAVQTLLSSNQDSTVGSSFTHKSKPLPHMAAGKDTNPYHVVGSHLVGVHVVVMWEVQEGDEHPDTVTLQPIPVQAIGHHPSHKVLPCARPAMEGQDQSLLGLWALQEPLQRLHHHFLGQVLPVELPTEVCLQPCRERARAQPSQPAQLLQWEQEEKTWQGCLAKRTQKWH